MARIFYFCVLLMILGRQELVAQNYLVLEKSGADKSVRFEVGEPMRFKLKNEKFFRKEGIMALQDSTIKFKDYEIYLNEIDKIDVRHKSFSGFDFDQIGTYTQIAGIGYILIDQLNKNIVQGQKWKFEKNVWITGGIIFVAGTILRMFHLKKYAVSSSNKLFIVEKTSQ